MKKILITLMACALCIGLVGGAFAYFTDVATSTGNTFTSGTVYITLEPATYTTNIGNMWPGDTETVTLYIDSIGTLPLNYTITTALTGDITGGDPSTNPVVSHIWVNGVETNTGSLSAKGGGHDYDLVKVDIYLPTAAGNNYEGKNGNLAITFNATSQ